MKVLLEEPTTLVIQDGLVVRIEPETGHVHVGSPPVSLLRLKGLTEDDCENLKRMMKTHRALYPGVEDEMVRELRASLETHNPGMWNPDPTSPDDAKDC
jgi:hypothetical protein